MATVANYTLPAGRKECRYVPHPAICFEKNDNDNDDNDNDNDPTTRMPYSSPSPSSSPRHQKYGCRFLGNKKSFGRHSLLLCFASAPTARGLG